jgi:hypothetical protein
MMDGSVKLKKLSVRKCEHFYQNPQSAPHSDILGAHKYANTEITNTWLHISTSKISNP